MENQGILRKITGNYNITTFKSLSTGQAALTLPIQGNYNEMTIESGITTLNMGTTTIQGNFNKVKKPTGTTYNINLQGTGNQIIDY